MQESNVIKRSEWVTCIAVITFDLELGQKLEHIYPSIESEFTDEERINLCFSSFPESVNSECDIVYSFRLNRAKPKSASDKDALTPTEQSLFGFVFFRQVKDESISRGYLQKSIVLISSVPYINLFKEVVTIAGRLYFEHGTSCLEAAYRNICAWPRAEPGNDMDLPILGTNISFRVPRLSGVTVLHNKAVQSASVSAALLKDQLVTHLQGVNLYARFKSMLNKLTLLWELILSGESLLVVSPSPEISSDAVYGLVSLISPIEYCGDFRPYFTIHDPDFKHFSSDKIPAATIIGATNPFFLKALEHWSHVITLEGNFESKMSVLKDGKEKKLKRGDAFKNELKSKYKALLETDVVSQALAKKKSDSPQASDDQHLAAVNNELIRRALQKLTEEFLTPVEEYFSTLLPDDRSISAFKKPPKIKPFRELPFLQHLIDTGKKTKEMELYRKFIRTQNFVHWFKNRKRQALHNIRNKYLKSLEDADIARNAKKMNEVEVVDMYLRVSEILSTSEFSATTKQKVIEVQKAIFDCLPPDLQQSVLLNQKKSEIYATDMSVPTHRAVSDSPRDNT